MEEDMREKELSWLHLTRERRAVNRWRGGPLHKKVSNEVQVSGQHRNSSPTLKEFTMDQLNQTWLELPNDIGVSPATMQS